MTQDNGNGDLVRRRKLLPQDESPGTGSPPTGSPTIEWIPVGRSDRSRRWAKSPRISKWLRDGITCRLSTRLFSIGDSLGICSGTSALVCFGEARGSVDHIRRRGTTRAALAVFGIALAPLLLAGCGQKQYEKRIEETAALFARIEVLDANLAGDYRDSFVSIRVPRQFRMIPAPPPKPKPKPGEEAVESADFDPRQPDFANVELPGLRAAFEAQVDSAAEGNATAKQKAYIYLLSNHTIAAAKKPIAAPGDGPSEPVNEVSPSRFAEDVASLLAGALEAEIKPSRHTNEWVRETHPRNVAALFPSGSESPFPAQTYSVGTLSSVIREVPVELSLYLNQQGPAQVVVVFVTPRDILPSEQFGLRRDLALETLRLLSTTVNQSAPATAGTGPTAVAPGAPAAPAAPGGATQAAPF